MIKPNNLNRIASFFEVLRCIDNTIDIESNFSDEETQTYRFFANSISNVISKLYSESEYSEDTELIISLLEEVYRNSMLEKYIQNNDKLISCFIKGNFMYRPSFHFPTIFLKDFLIMFKRQPVEMKNIILNHLWNRFDKIERKETEDLEDDLPF